MSAPTTTPTAGLLREIDRRHESGRDWDHEGDLNTLETECAIDRAETGCTAHDFYVYDYGHYLVWRVWSDAAAVLPPPEKTQATGVYFSARWVRGRIKGGHRITSETNGETTTLHVDYTRRGWKQAQRKAVRDGVITHGEHMATALLGYVRQWLERRVAR